MKVKKRRETLPVWEHSLRQVTPGQLPFFNSGSGDGSFDVFYQLDLGRIFQFGPDLF